jgi:hypothetical protein
MAATASGPPYATWWRLPFTAEPWRRTAYVLLAPPAALIAVADGGRPIAKTLVVSDRAVEKHIANIFLKLGLPPSGDDHRRVLAVLRYLGA